MTSLLELRMSSLKSFNSLEKVRFYGMVKYGGDLVTTQKDFTPLLIPIVLIIIALSLFAIAGQGSDIMLFIVLGIVMDIGFIYAFILAWKTNNRFVKIVSMLMNVLAFVVTTSFLYLTLLGIGISES